MHSGEIEGNDDDTKMYDYFQEILVLASPKECANLDQNVEMHDSGQDTTEYYTSCEHDSEDGPGEDGM